MDSSARYLRRISVTLRAAVISTAVLLAVWLLKDILLLVFASILFACALRGAADQLHRYTGMGPGWSLLVVVVVLLAVSGGLLWWRGPQIADEAAEIGTQLASQMRHGWQNLQDSRWGPLILSRLRNAGEQAGSELTGYLSGFASSTLGLLSSLVVVIATALFFAISPGVYADGAVALLPQGWRPRGREVLKATGHALQLWFMGQFLDMVVVAVLVGIGLLVLGVKLALTLALFAGLMNFVPYIGAIAGAIPAVLVALAQSPTQALWVALLYVVVQTLEGNVIGPLIQRRTVDLPPALTILSQTILGTLFGVMGLILATPVTAAALVAIRMVYVESVLGDKPD